MRTELAQLKINKFVAFFEMFIPVFLVFGSLNFDTTFVKALFEV